MRSRAGARTTSSCLVAVSSPTTTLKRSKKRGVGALFKPGIPLTEIVDWIKTNIRAEGALKPTLFAVALLASGCAHARHVQPMQMVALARARALSF